jgi:hypothetical protein
MMLVKVTHRYMAQGRDPSGISDTADRDLLLKPYNP